MNVHLRRALLATFAAQAIGMYALPASAQDIVMRRPLPRSAGGATPPVVDSEQTDTVVIDPVAVCDTATGSPAPVLQSATWIRSRSVDTPSSTPNCVTRTDGYHCEAYYTCAANGDNVVSGGVVDDQICKDHAQPIYETPS